MIKVKIDTSVGQIEACVAAIGRDLDGNVLLMAAVQLKSTDMELAEVETMLLGLKLAVARIRESCIVVSGAMNLLKYFTNRASTDTDKEANNAG